MHRLAWWRRPRSETTRNSCCCPTMRTMLRCADRNEHIFTEFQCNSLGSLYICIYIYSDPLACKGCCMFSGIRERERERTKNQSKANKHARKHNGPHKCTESGFRLYFLGGATKKA